MTLLVFFNKPSVLSRHTYASIDLQALRHNYRCLSAMASNSRQVVVVKADAYGNGAARVATALADQADMFAVAFMDEVHELRDAGITQPILVLQGPHEAEECEHTLALNIVWVLHHNAQLQWLEQAVQQGLARPACHWIKFDTGMHRLGFMPAQFADLKTQYPSLVNDESVLITHFSAADEICSDSLQAQLQQFEAIRAQHKGAVSLSNSAANIQWPQTHGDWNRMGIALYGSSPFEQQDGSVDLKPVMALHASVIALRKISVGESVGYGDTWVAARETLIATVGIGYADGYPRHAPCSTPVWIAGQLAPRVGRVSMDMLTIDVTDIADVNIGTPVELWGANLAINKVADWVGTIGYELMTRVSRRVPRRSKNA